MTHGEVRGWDELRIFCEESAWERVTFVDVWNLLMVDVQDGVAFRLHLQLTGRILPNREECSNESAAGVMGEGEANVFLCARSILMAHQRQRCGGHQGGQFENRLVARDQRVRGEKVLQVGRIPLEVCTHEFRTQPAGRRPNDQAFGSLQSPDYELGG